MPDDVLPKKAVDVAINNVYQYLKNKNLQTRSLNDATNYLIGFSSIILKKINEASKYGIIEMDIYIFDYLQEIGLNTKLFSLKEIKKIINDVESFLVDEGFICTIIDYSRIRVKWPINF